MANLKITDMTETTTISGTDILPVVYNPGSGFANRKMTVANFKTAIFAGAVVTSLKVGSGGTPRTDALEFIAGTNMTITDNGDNTITFVAVGGMNQLTGDVTAGPGTMSQVATLATVNSNVGSFTKASITVDAKGRVTAASSGSVALADLPLTSSHIIVGNGSNVGVDDSTIMVDLTNHVVGIGVTPDSNYKLKVSGGVYFAGSGADLNVGRSIYVGTDNIGTIHTYYLTTKDTAAPLTMNSGIARGIVPGSIAGDVSGAGEGEFWYDSTNHVLKFHNGTTIKTVATL